MELVSSEEYHTFLSTCEKDQIALARHPCTYQSVLCEVIMIVLPTGQNCLRVFLTISRNELLHRVGREFTYTLHIEAEVHVLVDSSFAHAADQLVVGDVLDEANHL